MKNEEQRSASFLATAKAVFWSFLGVRRKSDYQQDMASLKPHHVIIAGIIGGVLFVLTVLMVVRLVISTYAH